jgi:hypothetical protein
MRKVIPIPRWEDANNKVMMDKEDPLDWFVYQNEPVGKESEMKFRETLRHLIDYIVQLCNEDED